MCFKKIRTLFNLIHSKIKISSSLNKVYVKICACIVELVRGKYACNLVVVLALSTEFRNISEIKNTNNLYMGSHNAHFT